MDELLQNLEQATNPDPTVQSNLAQYINLQIENPDFGDILFEILETEFNNISPQTLSICCNILKIWAKIQWASQDFEKKCFFFTTLKNLLIKEHPVIEDLSIVFIDVAKHSLTSSNTLENTRCYESHIFDFFNRISAGPPLAQLHALTNIIYFISRRYKHFTALNDGSEPTLLFTRVINVFLPLFESQEELMTTSEGSEILFMSLSIFKSFFFHVFTQKVTRVIDNIQQACEVTKMMMEKAIVPLNFAQNVLVEFSEKGEIDLRLVAHCCRFLNSFYKQTIFKEDFSQISEENDHFEEYFNNSDEILELNFAVLEVALDVASSDTFLIPSILKVFETFRKFLPPQIEMLNIILSSAELTPVDKEEFFNSPNIFYLNVYEKLKDSDSNAAPQISKSIVYSMVKKNFELLLYMLSIPIEEEHVIRCIGYCLPLLNQLEPESEEYVSVLSELNQYYDSLLDCENEDPIFVAARLYFLFHFVPFLPEEQRCRLMEDVCSRYFELYLEQTKTAEENGEGEEESDENGFAIIMLNTCELFKRLLKFDVMPSSFEESLQTLVTFHSHSFTPIVIDTISLLANKERDKIIPFAESILEKAFINLDVALSQFLDAAGDAKQIVDSTDSISSNLSLCSMLIESSSIESENEEENETDKPFSSCLIKPEFLTFIQAIFENEITDCYEELIHLLSVIFSSDSDLIHQVSQLWFHFSGTNEWKGFIDQLIEPFFCLISHSPHFFNELNLTEQIEEICLTHLIDQSELPNPDSVYRFASLISWICLVDVEFDVEPEFQCVQLICGDFCSDVENSTDSNIVLILSLFDVMASLTVSRKILPEQHVLEAMVDVAVKQNWVLKVSQKRLYSLFLLTTIIASRDEIGQNKEFFSSLLNEALNLLNEEVAQRNLGDKKYFENFDEDQIPSELAFLIEDDGYDEIDNVNNLKSPQEKINIAELIDQIVTLFNEDFIQSLKAQFPNISGQLFS